MTDKVDSQSGVGGNQDWRVTAGPRHIHRALDRGSIPQGVVVMEKNEVAKVMHQIMDNWKPKKEMWDPNCFSLHPEHLLSARLT